MFRWMVMMNRGLSTNIQPITLDHGWATPIITTIPHRLFSLNLTHYGEW